MGDSFISTSFSSSMLWRNSEEEIFSRALRDRDENDMDALKRAALEKVPVYRDEINTFAEKDMKDIDFKGFGAQERRSLLERLVKVAEEDHEKFLLKLKDRINQVGLNFPSIEVRIEHLNVQSEAFVRKRYLPSIFNIVLNKIQTIADYLHLVPIKKVPFTILHDVSGIVRPRRLTLLLGPPGSGKTTLLLALAGKLGSELKVRGKVTYNGYEMNEFVPQRSAAYISQQDLHTGQLTVRETLAFSARCQGIGSRYDMLTELVRREKAANVKPDPDIDAFMKAAYIEGKETVVVDYIIKILGLEICADIMVGDEMLRGISGGQKKRVTTGEMIVGPAQALFMDEISTGLDSSTTFQIINSLRQIVHILGGTSVVSLLQPAPETYELFDDIIILSDGYIVYQGPREEVLEFFKFMGFECPRRKGVADFLQEVTSAKDQHQYWARLDRPYKFVPAKKFAKAFYSFHVGKKLTQELIIPFDKRKSHRAALTTSKYGVKRIELLKACLEREFLLMKRNAFIYIFGAIQVMFTAFVMITLFWRSNMHHNSINDGIIYMGALYFANITIMSSGFAELGLTIFKLPVFFKQRDSLFFPSWAYSIPTFLLKIPFSLIESALWIILTYYPIGFDGSPTRLFKQYLLLVLVNQMSSGLSRFLAVTGRTMMVASVLATYALLVFIVLSGYIIAYGDVKKWWIWGYWMSPLMYSQNAITINEFLGKSWSDIIPGTNETLGVSILKSRGIFTDPNWYWIGIAALFGYAILFNILFTIGLSYFKPAGMVSKKKEMKFTEELKIPSIGKKLIQQSAGITMSPMYKLNERPRVLPFIPLSVTFENITYAVDMPQEMKTQGPEEKLVLLNGLSGCFRPGVLTALMGVSGAGKTTLLDVLAGRKTGGYIEGKIMISGYPKNQETFARVSGYCEQNDIHSPNVTVYESLVYSAWLRLPAETDSMTRNMFVEEIMEISELTPLRRALVGFPGVNGLTIEQRKRLTIAVELVANPSILFMDEPTSGLDARAAAIVMRIVQSTVNTGRTVVCTIHQPSIDIFESFDELFLMKRGGEEIYVGPLGRYSNHLIKYFEEIEGVNMIKDGYNPATWMLEVTSQVQEQKLGVDFSEIYKNSSLYRRNKLLIEELNKPSHGSCDLYFQTKYSQPFLIQCLACLWKQNLSYWRNSSYTGLRLFFTVVIALMFGTIFWGLGGKKGKQQDLFNAMGSMYGAILFMGVSYSAGVQPVVALDRTVFYRERAAGMYSALPYAFGQVLIEQPYILFQSVLYGMIVYSMIGFEWSSSKLLWYFFFSFFTLLYYTYFGMLAVSLTPNFNIAGLASSAIYGIWNLFSGFIIPRTGMPIWWRWYYWACPVSWTLHGLLVSQYGDVHDLLDTNQTVSELLNSYFGFWQDQLGLVAFMVAFFAVLFAFLFGVGIKYLNFQTR